MSRRAPRVADKQMEYPDAPSGFVRLYRYKEPFIPYKKGHGYEGVLLMDGSGKTVQCHLCGEWMPFIHKWHLRDHGVTTAEYKDQVGLDQTTALCSEEYRKYLLNRKPPKAKDWSKETKEERAERIAKWRKTFLGNGKRFSREKQNARGTCPEQLIQRLKDKRAELGRDVMYSDIRSWAPTLVTVFGSHQEAFRRAGLPIRDIHAVRNLKTSKEVLLEIGREFYTVHGRAPTISDHRRGLLSPGYGVFTYRWGTHRAFRRELTRVMKNRPN